MTLQEYQKETSRTNPDLGNKHLNACHMILGMVGETTEIENEMIHGISDKLAEEMIDRLWYVSELANFHDHPLELRYNECTPRDSIGWIAENYKKYMAYGKDYLIGDLRMHLNNICYHTNVSLSSMGYELEKQLQLNIDKLRKRFPDKFNAKDALAKKDEL